MKYLTCECGYQVVIGKNQAFVNGKKAVVVLVPDFKPRFISFKQWKEEYSDCARYLRKWWHK